MQANGGWICSHTHHDEATATESRLERESEQRSPFPRALAKEQLRKLKARNFPGTLEDAMKRNHSALKAARRFDGADLRLEEFPAPSYRLTARG
jgi:hypothetical protein